MLNGKKIILGVCGSIAAYKSAYLVRALVKSGAEVRVVMTPDAATFVTPLTFSTLSKNPVYLHYSSAETGVWNNHVDLALWADLILVAPATANTLAKLASGGCDNLLAAVYLSATCPVLFAPSMDLDMWKHPATCENIRRLTSFGNTVIPPGFGELASGLVGEGRMAEPDEIVLFVHDFLKKKAPLSGKKALVSAGPTYEALDPVRFIGNYSSGKMGYAIAEELARLGADVTLVSGPSALPRPKNVTFVAITSAAELFDEMLRYFPESHLTVMSAAVADYRPRERSDLKIKKKSEEFVLPLVKTRDVLQELGNQKRPGQLLVGFALETHDEETNAVNKMVQKNLDFIVLNSLNDKGAGFGGDQNKVTIIDRHHKKEYFGLKSKTEVAADICQTLLTALSHA